MALEPSSQRALRSATEVVEELGLSFADAVALRDQSNLLNTASGPIWTDWEDTFRGPREWDLACLVTRSRVLSEGAERAEAALEGYGSAVDDDVLDLLVEARAIQVTAWLAIGSLSIPSKTSRLEERLAWLRARDQAAT